MKVGVEERCCEGALSDDTLAVERHIRTRHEQCVDLDEAYELSSAQLETQQHQGKAPAATELGPPLQKRNQQSRKSVGLYICLYMGKAKRLKGTKSGEIEKIHTCAVVYTCVSFPSH